MCLFQLNQQNPVLSHACFHGEIKKTAITFKAPYLELFHVLLYGKCPKILYTKVPYKMA